MRRLMRAAGVVLLLAGIVSLLYQGLIYWNYEVPVVGWKPADTDAPPVFLLPPLVGLLALVFGFALLVTGVHRRSL